MIPISDRDFLEGSITQEELRRALKEVKPGKSPGPDGLATQYYKLLEKPLTPHFVDTFNTLIDSSAPSSLLEVIPKPGKDHMIAKNYRPIFLLNTDIKLYIKFCPTDS